MSGTPLGYPVFKAFTPAGVPAAGYKVQSYAAGTSTPQATYTTAALTVPNPNPVILDANGEAQIWLAALSYKIVLLSDVGVVMWTMDNISGVGGGGVAAPVWTNVVVASNPQPLVSGTDVLQPLIVTVNDALAEVSGGRFLAQQAGNYFVNGTAYLQTTGSTTGITGTQAIFRLYKNGSPLTYFALPNWPFPDSVSRLLYVPATAGIALNASDYLQFAINATFNVASPPTGGFTNVNIRRIG